ncbi:MAG: TonB-dependent receptor [Gammaproteobacteria bacterium RIFCSPHIGHO2_12_FULL_63_22]|nr:MAG: TonB-dependent receptor [Gammaproteobacteria bacterium RIFCSPHIGHO2_12_FULL_63_22]
MARTKFASLRPDLLALAIVLALPSSFAFAQEADKPAEPAKPTTLEAVKVTAERRVEDIQDVPVSITAISGEKLDVLRSGGEDVKFLAGRLPSLQIESSFGRAFPRFYIRGLGNTDFDLNASQPVSLVYDDVVQENAILKGFPVFDLDQIELLRGPQGTQFGRNSPAGVVKFDSARPESEFGGYGRISYGTFGTTNIEGAVTGALSDTVSARFSGIYQRRADWVDNTFTGEDDALEGYEEYAARLQFLIKPSEDFEALLNVHTRHLDGTARLFRANIITPGDNELVPGFERDEISIDGDNYQKLDQIGGNARLTWNFGSTSLFSITGYESVDTISRGDIDGGYGAFFLPTSGPGFIPFAAESADGMPSHRQFSQEFRLQSNEWGRFDWQAGLYYFDEDFTIDSYNYDSLSPGRPQNGFATQEQQTKAWAIYLSGDYDLTESLKLRAGVRYTDDQKDFVANRLQAPPFSPTFIGQLSTSTDATDTSWDVSATWAASEDVNVYARIANGFRAPSIQGRLLFGDSISTADSETVLSREIGIKADLFEKRARVSLTAFDYTVYNQQLTAVGGAANFNQLINARRTEGRGFELDFDAYLGENLLVTWGTSLNDTEINDPNLFTQGCGGGCDVTDPEVPPGSGIYSIDGNRLPQAPKWIHNFTARYAVPLARGEFFAFTDWSYRSEINYFLYESAEFHGKPLLEGGLRVGYNWADGDREVAVFGRNITNEEQLIYGIDFNNLTGVVNEPRTFGVEFKGKF